MDRATIVHENFLRRVAQGESLLDPEVEWRNTGMPTVRGARVHAMVRDLERPASASTCSGTASRGPGPWCSPTGPT